ncbi:MAG: DNA-binding transcriptional LysR family regulator [Myxococcota bacterium]|jgi:DNA-binding transcriptional LysR family regulator
MNVLDSMRAFREIVEAGSFTEAARRRERSNAVMSRHVSRLEDHLGVSLLHRTTRAQELTEAGRAFYDGCVSVLSELEMLEGELRHGRGAPSGVLRVAATRSVVRRYLDVLVAPFTAQHPDITIDLSASNRLPHSEDDSFDILLCAEQPNDPLLVVECLSRHIDVLCATPAYLAGAPALDTIRDLRNHACLADANAGTPSRWSLELDGRKQSISVSGPARSNDPLVLRELALSGLGIVLLPLFLAEEQLWSGDLVRVLSEARTTEHEVCVAYPRRRYLSPKVRLYVDYLMDALSAG